MITMCSIFRNAAGYVDRYLTQARRLSRLVDLRLVLTWGDSTDVTGALLREASGLNLDVDRFDHGGPRYGSVDLPERWDQIAKVVRHTLDRVGDPGDALIWVEGDLIWKPETMLALIDDLNHAPTVAPQLLAEGSARWYDTWGYRRDGRQFDARVPYHDGQPDPGTGLIHIDSCGSCWATHNHSWQSWSGHWPFHPPGGLWLDPTLTVWHP